MIPGVQGSSFLFLSHSPALAYHSFLQANLREGGPVTNFFLCWYPAIRRNTVHVAQRTGTDKE